MMATALRFSRRHAACAVLLLTACAQAPSGGAAAAQGTSTAAEAPAPSPTHETNADAVRYAHDDVGQPGLALPAAIVRALGTDERVLSCAEGTRDGTSQLAPDWIAARRIDLDDDGQADWIINGRHACLRDGDTVGWWVYADSGDAQRLLLRAAMAASLEVLASRTQGFRDLRLQRAGGDVMARYAGDRYALPAPDAGSSARSDVAAPEIPHGGPLDTVAGRIEITELPMDDGGQAYRVTLGGREIRRTGAGGEFDDFPKPEILLDDRQGIVPFDQVVVFQQQMRGNACNGGPLWILGLHRDGRAVASEPIDFCGGRDPVLSATREALTITLPGGPPNRGDGMIPTEVWRYRDGKVSPVASP